MEYRIVWTPRAAKGYARILKYLDKHWNEKEVEAFEKEMGIFFKRLKKYPKLLPASGKHKNYRRGPINKFTILTYKFNPREGQIQLLNLRSAKEMRL